MIEVTLSPIILQLGPFRITYYALVYLLGFILVTLVLLNASKKKKINLSEPQVYNLMILGFLGMLIGARLFHVFFWNWSYYSQHLSKIPAIWEGGVSYHGGLVGATLVVLFYAKKNKINLWKLADILILPLSILPAFSRIANLLNHEIIGTVSNLPWCVSYAGIEGCRHPVQIYASTGHLLLFFTLLHLNKKEHNPGFLFWVYITLIATGRFFLDFLRQDARFLSLSLGQWFSIVLIILGIFILATKYKENISSLIKRDYKNI